jgi:hypothetical protein
MILAVMSIRRHLFPLVGSFIIMADIPPPSRQKPEPSEPPSSPGCTMSRAGAVAEAIAAAKLGKA